MNKQDTFGDDGFRELFAAYARMDTRAFIEYAQGCIERSLAKAEKKAMVKRNLAAMTNKDRALKATSDFFLAGEGHKVISA